MRALAGLPFQVFFAAYRYSQVTGSPPVLFCQQNLTKDFHQVDSFLIKQADVLLLMPRLPQLFTGEEKKAAWEDFEPICLHDSTLRFASHALFALQNGFSEKGMDYLRKALLLDLRDIMGNTGHEGLHLACMGKAWQAAFVVNENRINKSGSWRPIPGLFFRPAL